MEQIPFPNKKYQIIYADPPWSYRDKALAGNRGAGCKYQVQEKDWIDNLLIDAQDNSFSGLMDVIEKAYRMEYNLYDDYEDVSVKIFKLNDLCVFDFLQFFRVTQKEAVAEYSDKINLLEGVDTKSKFELLALENQLFG